MFCLQEEEDKKRPKRSATSTKTTRSKKARQATSDEEEDDDSNDSEYEVCQAIFFMNRLDDKSCPNITLCLYPTNPSGL